MDKALGIKIKKFRELRDLSQFQLELQIGASAGSLSRIENGQVNPTKETIFEIAKALNLDDDEVVSLYSLDIISSQTILNVINSISEGSNVDEIMQTAVNEISFKLGYTNVAVFLLDKDRVLRGKYYCQNKMSIYIMNKVGVPSIYFLNVDESKARDNLLLRAALDNKIYEGTKLLEFGKGAVSPTILKIIEEYIQMKKALAIPLVVNNVSFGSMFIAKSNQSDYSRELGLITALSKQLSIMIANMKILSKLDKEVSKEYLFE